MSIERAQLLLQQHRPELALRELQPELAEDPNSGLVHLLMAECLVDLDRYDEALEHAEIAVHLEPEWDYPQFALGRVYLLMGKPKKALPRLQEAVRLDPEDADNYGLLSRTYIALSDWQMAVETAERGLAVDPDSELCLNSRIRALTKLGRHEDAEESIRGALRRNPENPSTHANLGWEQLHQSRAEDAMHSFREALRLDPTSAWARAGLVEALKAKNPVYGAFLRYVLWMERFPPRVQFALIIGLLVGSNVLRSVLGTNPKLAPLAGVVSFAYVAFVLLTWTAKSLFNLLLFIHPIGRHALFRTQKIGAALFGSGFLAAALVLVVSRILNGPIPFGWFYVLPFFLLFPFTVVSKARPVVPLLISGAYALGALGLLIAGFVFVHGGSLRLFIYACVLSTWLGNMVPRASLDEYE